ncbi:DUF5694 domain-containing protein [Flagellimonas sp. DF-77]|uniref:DUF5694 domain-containing protein n=1 Tax=Flagellimonas algarum TaxID=3230298 RepID=UPI003391CF7C
MKKALCSVLAIVLWGCNQNEPQTADETDPTPQKEVLLIGTFHYNNPGADVAKTKSFDVMSEEAQAELEAISARIKAYRPTKIFVEWPYDEQSELDSLYRMYHEGRYFSQDSLSDFYLKNEIFQLAFRTAHASDLQQVYGIDYKTSFPFEAVMGAIQEAEQTELLAEIQNGIQKFTSDFDTQIEEGTSLMDLTYYLNETEMRRFSNYFHTDLMLLAGNPDDFSGPLLTSEWYKRNLYMWSLALKQTQTTDERIMVLVGASHAAMFERFIADNEEWRVRELQELMTE